MPLLLLIIVAIFAVTSCDEDKPLQKSGKKDWEDVDITRGEELSKQYCSGCHLYPEPNQLDKQSWEIHILPTMGYLLGIYNSPEDRQRQFNESTDTVRLIQANIFPEKPILDTNDWKIIKAYYMQNAPYILPRVPRDTILKGLPQFEYKVPQMRLNPPSTTLIQFTMDGMIALGDDQTKQLYMVEPEEGRIYLAGPVGPAPVSMIESKTRYTLTLMGSFSPTDKQEGSILMLPKGKGEPTTLAMYLTRPVHTDYSDVNKDGIPDLVVSEFGKWLGGLTFMESTPTGYNRKLIKDKTGAIRAYFVDMDGDKIDEVIALYGQGDEGIWAYKKNGDVWEERELLRFPPTWGSSYFALQDINGDGHLDIIYCGGDNADYGPLIKPYHGIRVFQNDGKWNFTQTLFIPHNGVYKAIFEDFDKDGDLDIAAISFFPDYIRHPDEGFIYYENAGDKYIQHTFDEFMVGRWITMDVADYNKDGYPDIVLGSIAFNAPYVKGFAENIAKVGIPYILLKNRGKEAGTPFQKNILE